MSDIWGIFMVHRKRNGTVAVGIYVQQRVYVSRYWGDDAVNDAHTHVVKNHQWHFGKLNQKKDPPPYPHAFHSPSNSTKSINQIMNK